MAALHRTRTCTAPSPSPADDDVTTTLLSTPSTEEIVACAVSAFAPAAAEAFLSTTLLLGFESNVLSGLLSDLRMCVAPSALTPRDDSAACIAVVVDTAARAVLTRGDTFCGLSFGEGVCEASLCFGEAPTGFASRLLVGGNP